MMQLDVKEITVRLLKYFVEGLIVSICAFALPGKKIHAGEVMILGLVAAATFSILDLFAPSIATSARQGAGFGIGSGVVGGIHVGR